MLLQLKHSEIENKIKAKAQSRLTRIETFIKIYEQEDYIMKYDIVLKRIEEIKVAALRDFIPSYSEQEQLWIEIGEYLEKKKARIVSPCMVIYYDSYNKEDKVDAEIIEPIVGDLEGNDRIKVRNLESVEQMASVVHKGSYQTISFAYNALTKWIQENGYTISGPKGNYI